MCDSQGKDLLLLQLISSSIIYTVRNHSKPDDPVLFDTGVIINEKTERCKMGYPAGGSWYVWCIFCACVYVPA